MKTAIEFMQVGIDTLTQRGEVRDQPGGERSAARAAAIFTAWTGREITESDIWRVLQCVKMARSVQGRYHEDDNQDMICYSALLAECESRNNA